MYVRMHTCNFQVKDITHFAMFHCHFVRLPLSYDHKVNEETGFYFQSLKRLICSEIM